MTDKEVMQMALNALEILQAWPETPENFKRVQAIEALRTALAQPEKIECSRSHPHENMGSHCQLLTDIARLTNENARLKAQPEPEPVAWMHKFIDDVITKNRPTDITRNAGRWTSLYTAPIKKEWVGLNDEDRNKLHHLIDWTVPLDIKKFADAVEAKLKEKNT